MGSYSEVKQNVRRWVLTQTQPWTLFSWDLKWCISARYLSPWRSRPAATLWPVGRATMKTSRWDGDAAKRWPASAARRGRRGGACPAPRISVSAGQWRQRLKHNTVVIWTVLSVCHVINASFHAGFLLVHEIFFNFFSSLVHQDRQK